MSDDKIDKILDKIREKLESTKIPNDATGKIIVGLQSGGISGIIKLELTL